MLECPSSASTAPAPDFMAHTLSIIVPVYNEAGTVAAVVNRLLEIDLPVPREIVVVNDGSTDGTFDVLQGLEARPGLLQVVHVPVNGGKGSAIRAGFARATGTVFAIQDADLELDPAQLGALVQPVLDGRARVVYGSRFLDGQSTAPWLTVFAESTTIRGVKVRAYVENLLDSPFTRRREFFDGTRNGPLVSIEDRLRTRRRGPFWGVTISGTL